ncbi:MAG TPA: methyltransferase domain-containing protein [Natronosporangium sp.]
MDDPIGRVVAPYQPHTVLDVGAGHGGSLSWLVESFAAATLLVAVDVAAPAQPPPEQVRFVRADATALPFPDRSLPAVTARAALHHVPDPPVAVRELARVLADGGVLVIRDATALSPERAAELHAYLVERGRPPEPHAGVDPDQLAQAAGEAGLTVISLDRAAGTAMLAGPRFATPAFHLVATRAMSHHGDCAG